MSQIPVFQTAWALSSEALYLSSEGSEPHAVNDLLLSTAEEGWWHAKGQITWEEKGTQGQTLPCITGVWQQEWCSRGNRGGGGMIDRETTHGDQFGLTGLSMEFWEAASDVPDRKYEKNCVECVKSASAFSHIPSKFKLAPKTCSFRCTYLIGFHLRSIRVALPPPHPRGQAKSTSRCGKEKRPWI